MAVDVKKILEGAGVKVESFDRIRLARGVVGKLSYVAAAALVVLAVVAFRVGTTALFAGTIAATVIIFLTAMGGILWFASKNPGLALLEGAELIQWRQMEMGRKGDLALPDEPNVQAPRAIEGPAA